MISSNIQMGQHKTSALVYNNVYMITKRDSERKMRKRFRVLVTMRPVRERMNLGEWELGRGRSNLHS